MSGRGQSQTGAELWFHAMPRLTKLYFSATMLTAFLIYLSQMVGISLWEWLSLDWGLVLGKLQTWRLSSNFLVLGSGLLSSCWHAGLLGCYLAQMQQDKRFRTERGSVEFLALLLVGAVLILATSFLLWPELRFGGPALLFWMLTIFSRMQPEARTYFLHPKLEYSLQWMPLVHVVALYLARGSWALASLGAGLAYAAMTLQIRTPLGAWLDKGLPESLYALGPRLRSPLPGMEGRGVRLGEAQPAPAQH